MSKIKMSELVVVEQMTRTWSLWSWIRAYFEIKVLRANNPDLMKDFL